MTQSSHQEIRRLIATSADDLSEAQQALLQRHLQDCGPCREYAAAAAEIVRAVRGIPVAADPRLVRNTQARVRARAFALRQRQQWLRLVALACPLVGMSAAITTPLVWRAFQWMGTYAGLSRLLWQAGVRLLLGGPGVAGECSPASPRYASGGQRALPRIELREQLWN